MKNSRMSWKKTYSIHLILNSLILVCLAMDSQGKTALKIQTVGSAYDSGSFRIGTSGIELNGASSGINKKNDGFLFAYGLIPGNCDIKTASAFIVDSLKKTEAGLMLRADTTDNAPFCALLVIHEKGTYLKYRSATGQNVKTVNISSSLYPCFWIERRDNLFRFHYKADTDSSWINISTEYTFSFPSLLYAGMFQASNDLTNSTSARFSYIEGLPEEWSSDSSCKPLLYNFDNGISLDSLGFTNIQNFILDDSIGKIVSSLNFDSCGIATVHSPQFSSETGRDTLTISWDLKFDGDTIPLLNDYSLFSVQSMELNDRVKITGSRIGSSQSMNFGINDTIHGDVYSGGNVFVKDRSAIWGKVIAEGACSLYTGSYVSGTINEGVNLDFPGITELPVDTGSTPKIIAPYDSIILFPGHYSKLNAGSNSKIRFMPGFYSFSSCTLQPEVRLYVTTDTTNRTDIRVLRGMYIGDRIQMEMNDTNASGNVSIYYQGSDTISLGNDIVLSGAFYAPHAVLHIKSRSMILNGGIYARKIKFDPDVTIQTDPPKQLFNNFVTTFTSGDSTEPVYSLNFIVHRGIDQDIMPDVIWKSNNNILQSVCTGENTLLGRNLYFELKIFAINSLIRSKLLYDNGNGLRLLMDTMPCNLSSIDHMIFDYHQNTPRTISSAQIDNVSISCVRDTCPQLILLENPSDTSVYEGATVTFSCSVETGNFQPVYQWLRDGVPVPMTNTPDFILYNVKKSDDLSEFQCRISGVCQQMVTTSIALLNVSECEQPEILSDPVSDTVFSGQNVIFSVSVAQGCLNPRYQWLRNDREIPNAISSVYSVNNVSAQNNLDKYCVRVSNGCGKSVISRCAILSVADIEPCRIIQHPTNDTLLVNDYYRTEIQVICNNGTYTWYKNGSPVIGSYGRSLIYGPVTMADNGAQFFCMVSNGVTTDTSNISVIKVRSSIDNNNSIAISGELYDGYDKLQGIGSAAFFDFTVIIYALKNGGTALYTETQKDIPVFDGQFTVTLGKGRFDGDLQKVTSNYKELYAEVHAGKNGTFRIVAPRLRLTAAPYAFSSGIKIIRGNGNPVSVEAPLGTLYVDEADSNATWKLGKLGWVKLD